ncbi:hypothetical protein ACIBF1_29950 [Spirillospora sp. NPDC050679]
MSNLTYRRLVALWAAAEGMGPGLKQPASGSGAPATALLGRVRRSSRSPPRCSR